MCTTIRRILENVFDYQREEDSLFLRTDLAANLDESSASESTDKTCDGHPESDHSATYGEERLSNKTSLTTKSNNKGKEELCSSLKKSTRGNEEIKKPSRRKAC